MAPAPLFNTTIQELLSESSTKTERFLQEVTKQILLSGISAPSAGKIQLRTFIAVENGNIEGQLYDCVKTKVFCESN